MSHRVLENEQVLARGRKKGHSVMCKGRGGIGHDMETRYKEFSLAKT